jgi:hypothetical protein
MQSSIVQIDEDELLSSNSSVTTTPIRYGNNGTIRIDNGISNDSIVYALDDKFRSLESRIPSAQLAELITSNEGNALAVEINAVKLELTDMIEKTERRFAHAFDEKSRVLKALQMDMKELKKRMMDSTLPD